MDLPLLRILYSAGMSGFFSRQRCLFFLPLMSEGGSVPTRMAAVLFLFVMMHAVELSDFCTVIVEDWIS